MAFFDENHLKVLGNVSAKKKKKGEFDMSIDISIYGVPGILGSWTPAELGSSVVKLWLKPESLTGAHGSNIDQWDDSSGNGNHATSSEGSEPDVSANYLDGYSAAAMNASRLFQLPSDIDATPSKWEVYFVTDYDGCTASDKLLDSATGRLIIGTDGSSNVAFHDGDYTEFGAIQAGKALYNLQLTADAKLFRNGVEKAIVSGNGYTDVALSGNTYLGAQNSGVAQWDGDPLVEFLILKGTQSAATRSLVYNYFAAKYPTLSL